MDEQISLEDFEKKAIEAGEAKRMCILLFQDADGNWRGGLQHKYPQPVLVRAIGPETVLQFLLTHDGK